MSNKEKMFVDYILSSMHWCPFEGESGVNFNECVGFGRTGAANVFIEMQIN